MRGAGSGYSGPMLTEGGQVLAGRYAIGAPLRPDSAEAFDAEDRLLRRPVVLAAIPEPGSTDGRRLVRAARTAARLRHPSLVTVYDVREEDGTAWVVVPLAPGVALDDALEDGPWRPSDVRAIGIDLADGLAAAHGAGVLHGHLVPARVALTAGPRARLSGLGVPAEPPQPPYLAPEQVGAESPTLAGDLWGLGTTLLTALLGAAPQPELLPRVDDRGTAAARPRLEGGDSGLSRIVMALLDADPHRRPSAASVVDLLRDDPDDPALHQRLEHL